MARFNVRWAPLWAPDEVIGSGWWWDGHAFKLGLGELEDGHLGGGVLHATRSGRA